MSSAQCFNQIGVLRTIFHRAVDSVRPKTLFAVNKSIQLLENRSVLLVGDHQHSEQQEIDLTGRQCHLVGFGKAVLGMAVQVEQLLGDRLVSGILSVPLGTFDTFRDDPSMQLRVGSVIEAYEGAADNLPDDLAAENASRILEKCKEMSDKDVLIVLISGGGSALIALPIDPVTIEEKRGLIKQLASRQANINEINAVRTCLSQTKGEKLAIAAGNAHRCVSLVLSDVCGDPLDVIASGPTFRRPLGAISPLDVLNKYVIEKDLPLSIKSVLNNTIVADGNAFPENSSIYVIGNNKMACDAALSEANAQNLRPVITSAEVTGNVGELAKNYIQLIALIYNYRNLTIGPKQWKHSLAELQGKLKFKCDAADLLSDLINNRLDDRPICLIAGGETTVAIKGSGIGGRNQELALRFSALLRDLPQLRQVVMLSAGTDGIDGPTTAAGAIGCRQVVEESGASDLDVFAYLENNDSFNFYKNLAQGRYHILTGHTGTNVMDLHIFVIPFGI